MTVKQLIEKLSACNPEAEVIAIGTYERYHRGTFTFSGAGAGGWQKHKIRSNISFVKEKTNRESKRIVILSEEQI